MAEPALHIFGIRHHGPGSARSLREALTARMGAGARPVPFGRADGLIMALSGLALLVWVASPQGVVTGMLAIAAGGALKASKTTKLLTGAQGIEALKKAGAVAKSYRPAK